MLAAVGGVTHRRGVRTDASRARRRRALRGAAQAGRHDAAGRCRPAATAAGRRHRAGTVAATAAAAPAAAGAPKTGGTLRVAIMADPASLDGHLFAAGRFDTTWLIYDRLTEYDLKLKPQPMLAESWDVSSDYKTHQAQPAQGRHVPRRSRVHQRRRQIQLSAGARPEGRRRRVCQSEQLVHVVRHARQEHHHPEVGSAAAAGVRLLRAPEHGRQEHHGRPGRQDQGQRHRPVQVRRVGPGRPLHDRRRTRTSG